MSSDVKGPLFLGSSYHYRMKTSLGKSICLFIQGLAGLFVRFESVDGQMGAKGSQCAGRSPTAPTSIKLMGESSCSYRFTRSVSYGN